MPTNKASGKIQVVSAEEQLAVLREKLMGHQAFGRCRGNFGHFKPYDFLNAETPSETLRQFADWTGDRKVMFNMLAQLKRDELTVAYHALFNALLNGDAIPSEDIPLSETSPVVLMMVEPEKTILLLRWLYTTTFEDAIHWIDFGKAAPERDPCGALTPQLIETFPDLREEFLRQRHTTHPVSPLDRILAPLEKAEGVLRGLNKGSKNYVWIEDGLIDNWYYGNAVAFLIEDVTQRDVLSMFPREEQGSIATWQFQIPTFLTKRIPFGTLQFRIGLHPEVEHPMWKKAWPCYASKGVSNGIGALLLRDNMRDQERCETSGVPLYDVPHLHPNFLEGDLHQTRMFLSLQRRS